MLVSTITVKLAIMFLLLSYLPPRFHLFIVLFIGAFIAVQLVILRKTLKK
jgi:uncharacterized BrkB/YihY/UPF0761 family membrane protein